MISATGARPQVRQTPRGPAHLWEFGTDNGNGSYTLNYSPVNPGTDMISITLNEEEIGESPFTVTVNPLPTTRRS
jgi:hypothetical protein